MPRGKELEQLPMANIAPGAGKDASTTNREVIGSSVQQVQPEPSRLQDQK